ncbi:MAG: hypothetical protein KDJ70_20890 [Candidatus Competibacteraceae bacterium]|nr:hypothetical protein [Candidatus Competibacteraceae bacterium]
MSPETASRQPAAATADTPKTPPHDSARPARDPHLESAFERLIGHQATPQDRARLHQVRDSLGLYPNDALWDVLIALQYYYSLYERFPAMIRGAARELLTECKNESDRHIAHAKQQVQHRTDAAAVEVAQAAVAAHASLEKTLQQSARRIALAAGFATRWPWVLGSAAAMAMALILTGAVALGFGRQQGYAAGYTAGVAVAMQPQRTPTAPLGRGR